MKNQRNDRDYSDELLIPFLSYILKNHPGGDYFTPGELKYIYPFRVDHKLSDLEGLLEVQNQKSRTNGKNEKHVGINQNSAWLFAHFPRRGLSVEQNYIDVGYIDQINALMGDSFLGKEGEDFELKFGPVNRQPYQNAFFLRAYNDKGNDKVCVFDLTRLAHLNYCLSENDFKNNIVPLILEDQVLVCDDTVCMILENEMALRYMWENQHETERRRTWRAFYSKNGDQEGWRYHVEMFIDTPILPTIRDFFNFNKIQPKKTKRKPRAAKKKKPQKIELFSGEKIPIKYYDSLEVIGPMKSPYLVMQNPGFGLNGGRQKHVGVYGTLEELENGGITIFAKETFPRLAEEGIYRVSFYKDNLYVMGMPQIMERMNDKNLIILTESHYELYSPTIFGHGKVEAPVMFLKTRLGGFGRHDLYPSPYNIVEIPGAPIIKSYTRSGAQIRQFDMFACSSTMIKVINNLGGK